MAEAQEAYNALVAGLNEAGRHRRGRQSGREVRAAERGRDQDHRHDERARTPALLPPAVLQPRAVGDQGDGRADAHAREEGRARDIRARRAPAASTARAPRANTHAARSRRCASATAIAKKTGQEIMSAFAVALAGKGGTGKTSISALTVRYLVGRKRGPVLAVDADSNACLNEALGLEVHATIGGLREVSMQTVRGGGERPGGMSMEQLFDYQVQQSHHRGQRVRPHGDGTARGARLLLRGQQHHPQVHGHPLREIRLRRHRQRGRDGAPLKAHDPRGRPTADRQRLPRRAAPDRRAHQRAGGRTRRSTSSSAR